MKINHLLHVSSLILAIACGCLLCGCSNSEYETQIERLTNELSISRQAEAVALEKVDSLSEQISLMRKQIADSKKRNKNTYCFDVLPRPYIYINVDGTTKNTCSGVRRSDLNNQTKLVASYAPDETAPAKFRINKFQVYLIGKTIDVEGDQFNVQALKLIGQLRSGDVIVIRNIMAVGPDGKTIQLCDLPIVMK